MEDFKIYDQAVTGFQKRARTNSMPLQSWDLFGSYFAELSIAISDSRDLTVFAAQHQWDAGFDFLSELEKDTVIVVTNPQIEIVYASRNMIRMNGYRPGDVIGKSPKIFQGEKTSKSVARQIGRAVRELRPFEATIVNIHKDGTEYNCQIKGFPVFTKNRELSHFIAFERVA